jgi:hypothetical protein
MATQFVSEFRDSGPDYIDKASRPSRCPSVSNEPRVHTASPPLEASSLRPSLSSLSLELTTSSHKGHAKSSGPDSLASPCTLHLPRHSSSSPRISPLIRPSQSIPTAADHVSMLDFELATVVATSQSRSQNRQAALDKLEGKHRNRHHVNSGTVHFTPHRKVRSPSHVVDVEVDDEAEVGEFVVRDRRHRASALNPSMHVAIDGRARSIVDAEESLAGLTLDEIARNSLFHHSHPDHLDESYDDVLSERYLVETSFLSLDD